MSVIWRSGEWREVVDFGDGLMGRSCSVGLDTGSYALPLLHLPALHWYEKYCQVPITVRWRYGGRAQA